MPTQEGNEQPTKFVRVLGEDLVLFKDRSGRIGLLAAATVAVDRRQDVRVSRRYGWIFETASVDRPKPPEHLAIESTMARSPGCPRDPRSRPSRAGRRSLCHQFQTARASVS